MASDLQRWAQHRCGNLYRPISSKRQHLESALGDGMDLRLGDDIRQLENELNSLLAKEELQWLQHSRSKWLQAGDQNTSYFHQLASTRRRWNTIHGHWDKNGQWCLSQANLLNIVIDFYSNLFTSHAPTVHSIHNITIHVPYMVSQDMSRQLLEPFTTQEVHTALNDIHRTKRRVQTAFLCHFFTIRGILLETKSRRKSYGFSMMEARWLIGIQPWLP